MAFDISNFVIDRCLRGVMTSTADGSVMYSINQIEEPSLNISADEVTAVDALGTTIATYNRAKNAEFSASNSLFDLGLLAAQMGTEKKVASDTSKLTVPIFETIDVAKGATTAELKYTPVTGAIDAIYELKGDSTLGTKYTVTTGAATDTQFVYDNDSKTITLPTSITEECQIFVMYEYETETAVSVAGTATEFPRAGKFVLEVLGNDVCDPTTLIYAYLVFPNAKLVSNVDLTFTTEGKHPFTLKCQQNYCDKDKKLFEIIIPQID